MVFSEGSFPFLNDRIHMKWNIFALILSHMPEATMDPDIKLILIILYCIAVLIISLFPCFSSARVKLDNFKIVIFMQKITPLYTEGIRNDLLTLRYIFPWFCWLGTVMAFSSICHSYSLVFIYYHIEDRSS